MKSPVELLLALLTDVGRLEPGARGLDRDIITIKKRVENEGDGFLTVALPTLCDALDRGLAEGRFACPQGFARIPRGTIPRLFSGMFSEIFDSVTGSLLKNPSVSMITSVRQVTRLFKKMHQSDDHDDRLDHLAKMQFIKDDESCSEKHSFSETELYILDRVSRYVLLSLDSFDEREVICKHGPGAVFEGLKPNQKWQALRTYSSVLERMGFDVFYGSDTEIDGELGVHSPLYGASGDEARLISVPKNSISRRTITIEPVVRQFVQQGYNTILRDSISRCPVLNRCLDLKHQEHNQRLALEGSLTGSYATLDLKSASDRMSIDIVSLIFRHRPAFLSGVLDCRSPKVSIDGCQYELRKYAGMGNATTFPVQSVVFAVLAIAALAQDSRPTYGMVKRVASSVRVFGDDIIVPTDKVHQVVSWITKAGLTVNLRKSFTEGNFRESCGVDAFAGVDVTPLYARFRPDKASRREPSIIAHYVSLSNQAWFKGYYAMSASIQELVEKRLRRRLPLVPRNSGGLGWHTRQDVSEIQRWNPDYHRFETNTPVLVSLKRRDEIDGYAALLKFFHRPQDEERGSFPLSVQEVDGEHLRQSPIRFKLRIVSRWVPS